MLISICRNGAEIGQWTESDIRAFYSRGAILATDHYWKEGMSEWLPVTSLVKPLPPIPAIYAKPAAYDWNEDFRGIGRLWFLALYILLILMAFFFGTVAPHGATGTLTLIGLILVGGLCFVRLFNIGYSLKICILYSVLSLIPLLGFVIFIACLFKSENSAGDII